NVVDRNIMHAHAIHIILSLSYCRATHRTLHSFPTRRSSDLEPFAQRRLRRDIRPRPGQEQGGRREARRAPRVPRLPAEDREALRSEEHTSELQSPYDLVCRLLLEKKKKNQYQNSTINHRQSA